MEKYQLFTETIIVTEFYDAMQDSKQIGRVEICCG